MLKYVVLLGFVRKLRNDGVDNISLVAIDDFHAPDFSAKLNLYKNQLEKNLAVNIFKKVSNKIFFYLHEMLNVFCSSLKMESFYLV